MALAPLLAAGYLSAITLVAGSDPVVLAWQVVEVELRRASSTPDAVRLRRVETFQQSAPDTVAVCGQVSPTGAESGFIDFAAVVTKDARDGQQVQELHLADTDATRARTRAETWLRCTDVTRRLDVTQRADVPPQRRPVPAAPPVGPGDPQVVPTVTMRQGGNLRAGPNGDSAVVRTIPRNTVARVFGEPQGGWYRIGDTEAWGWVHGSMLVAPPR